MEKVLTEAHDICPRCGAELPPSIADGIGAGDTGNGSRKVEHEERDCPSCGVELRRAVGGAWFLASETELG
jgi:ribosomal protein S27AE